MQPLFSLLITFAASFLLAVTLTPLIRAAAVKKGYVAHPRSDRWHRKPTGLLGGIGIFVSLMAAWQLGGLASGRYADLIPILAPVALGGTAIFILGLVDDILDINPHYKLIGQVVAASAMVFLGVQLNWFPSETANLVISIIWIVGITNAFNLLDNMDGLSAGIACISGVFLFFWLPIMSDDPLTVMSLQLMLAAYIGGLLGFLIYNFNPASIFMGDAGSLLIGFILACLTVFVKPSDVAGQPLFHQLSIIAIPCLILFIPIMDTAFVSFMRKKFSRSVFQGGRDHSSHRMVAVGLSERKAVIVLYLFAVAAGLLSLFIYTLDIGVGLVVMALFLVIVLLFWIYLANVDVYERPVENPDPAGWFVAGLMQAGYGRMLFSIFLDLVLITVAYYTSYLLRFEWVLGDNFNFFLKSLPILIACQILAFYVFGVYQRLWRGSRLGDVAVYVKAVTVGTVMTMLVLLFIYRFQSFSRTVFVIYWGLMLIFLSFSRFFFRIMDEWVVRENRSGKPVLIYGAGVGGQMVVREIETGNGCGRNLIGFIDDDPMKNGKKINGYPVFGGGDRLAGIITKYDVKEVIVSFKQNGLEKKNEVEGYCTRMGLDVAVSRMRMIIEA
jgi:UDP-GlcNAc:undecaprenyl-phosphate/decaprenyl-phosphate GlcNAc-1-phosphate transferase